MIIQRQFQIFLVSLSIFTRIPVAQWANFSSTNIQKSLRFFPFMGYVVGGISASVFLLSHGYLSLSVSVVLSMIASVLLTGAFHEDGLADTCDGLGGAWTRDDALKIMKDSRIGVYGTIALVLVFLLKFTLLSSMSVVHISTTLIVAHVVSRWMVLGYCRGSRYVQQADQRKMEAIAQGVSRQDYWIGSLFGVSALALIGGWIVCGVVAVVWIGRIMLGRYIDQRLGGYTGDCCGAMQQVCELLFYVGMGVAWNYI